MNSRITARAAVGLMVVTSFAFAGDLAKHANLDRNGVMLKGYDPVSYFVQAKPTPGRADITAQHDGVTYRFATDENRQKFLAEPTRYLPEYGGWCAKAVADKEKVDIDPLNYKITNGRLFLFYRGFLGDALKIWNQNEAELTRRADAAWPQMIAD